MTSKNMIYCQRKNSAMCSQPIVKRSLWSPKTTKKPTTIQKEKRLPETRAFLVNNNQHPTLDQQKQKRKQSCCHRCYCRFKMMWFMPPRFLYFWKILFLWQKEKSLSTLSSGFCVSPQVKIVSFIRPKTNVAGFLFQNCV